MHEPIDILLRHDHDQAKQCTPAAVRVAILHGASSIINYCCCCCQGLFPVSAAMKS
ncbi:hypothetical protein DAI22_01g068000 [Oryza sativa Japonica Group]|nr:hypothetical protein DAI22_01g068000 [Oryza sativa Japonica Group]